MMTLDEIATVAYKGVLNVRAKLGVSREDPINIYDSAERLGVEVRFVIGGTFEGIYEKERKIIIIASDRPQGRRAFTCAHELAHCYFNHGSRFDDETTLDAAIHDDDERIANYFSSFLLMFPPAVEFARRSLQIDFRTCSAINIYELASWFGVGYTSMLCHLRWTLKVLANQKYEQLRRESPRIIRSTILGAKSTSNLIIRNRLRAPIPIDAEIGDLIMLPRGVKARGECLHFVQETSTTGVWVAKNSGISALNHFESDWNSVARVMRKNYIGRAIYRNLEHELA